MNRFWITCAAIALLLGATIPADARAEATYEDGVAAYKHGDHEAALEIFRNRAEAGEAPSQAYLGAMYRLGQAVASDDDEAARWLRLAADQGHAEAQYSLATMYVMGLIDGPASEGDSSESAEAPGDTAVAGDDKSLDAAIFWYRGGTRSGHAEAAKWFHRAAERGLTIAQYRLGTMYAGGLAVPQDAVQAYKWLSLAAAGLPEGEGRDRLIVARKLVEEEMTPAQITEAETLVEAWRQSEP